MALDVYIEGHCAGTIRADMRDGIVFTYDDEYASTSARTPLSLSMPKRRLEHGGHVAERWIENLLPDNDDTRVAIADKFGSRATDAYSLLHYIGLDVAGAVQFVPEGESIRRPGALVPWDESRIAAEIDRLRADPAALDDDMDIGHWSLAGQHGKFSLARVGGTWMEPTGTQASTHIFKVGMNRFRDSDIAEFVTMRAAKILGLEVASVDLADFNGRLAVVIDRYDRVAGPQGAIRLHQEDLCQSLGLRRQDKYESDGGPSMHATRDVLRTGVPPTDRDRSVIEFAKLQAFNLVAANVDGHGKNTSLLLRGADVRLAPAYDLTSAALLWEADHVRFTGKLAMKFGGDYRLRTLSAARASHAASDLGINADAFVDAVAEFASLYEAAFSEALSGASDSGAAPETVARLRTRVSAWSTHIDGAFGAVRAGVMRPLSATASRPLPLAGVRNSTSSARGPSLEKRDACGIYIARSRSLCVLPQGHPGWPTTGHRRAG